jgi:short-subunit dehydrogenase
MTENTTTGRPLAVVTGASSGIGLALAKEFARNGFDLLITAEDDELTAAATELEQLGAGVRTVRADLATYQGNETVTAAARAAGPIDALALNAGIGVGGPFLSTDLQQQLTLVRLNVESAVHLARQLLPEMVERGAGRVLFTSSIAATQPGPYEASYAASKAFLLSFSEALRTELKDTGVTVTALMPGPTETEFFERAQMEDTKLGQTSKDDPQDVAREGFEALMAGKDKVVAGSFTNTVLAGASKVMPQKALSAAHAKLSEPGSGDGSS